MKILTRSLAVGAVTALTALSTATVAQAGTDAVSGNDSGAKVTFISYGDKFRVCDTEWDFFQVYNEYKYIRVDGSVQHDKEYVNTGDGTCATYDHNFGEGRSVTFRACVETPIYDSCHPWVVGIA
ncbi:hypothetical protein AB0425_25750 [Actinosynnema sp. NPDC051121]